MSSGQQRRTAEATVPVDRTVYRCCMTLTVPGILLYDGDCGFCTTTATALERRLGAVDVVVRPWQPDDEQRYGVTTAQAELEIHWVDRRGGVFGGADAVLAWWRTGHGIWPVLGRILTAPLLVQLTRWGYRIVARHRHRLPGATEACAVPQP